MRLVAAILGFGLIVLFGVGLFMALWSEWKQPVSSSRRIIPLFPWMGRGDDD